MSSIIVKPVVIIDYFCSRMVLTYITFVLFLHLATGEQYDDINTLVSDLFNQSAIMIRLDLYKIKVNPQR